MHVAGTMQSFESHVYGSSSLKFYMIILRVAELLITLRIMEDPQ